MIEVITQKIPGFSYRTPYPEPDENGELQVYYKEKESTSVSEISFLYRKELDESGNVRTFKPVYEANIFLMHRALNDGLQDVVQESKGLLLFFSFLEQLEVAWDEMKPIQSQRTTYRFVKHLEAMCRSSDPEEHLASSTAKKYVRTVARFYKFYMFRKYPFDYPPLELVNLNIRTDPDSTSMSSFKEFSVQATDLRLRIPKKQVGSVPQKLIALRDEEWSEVSKVIQVDRAVIRVESEGCERTVSLPVEFTLLFLMMRFVGLRRIEVCSFNYWLIYEPTPEQMEQGVISIEIGSSHGVKTKNDKTRTIEVPVPLMKLLHRYTQSKRYLERKLRYMEENPESWNNYMPLFLSSRNKSFSAGTINARWGEIRRTVARRVNYPFTHKAHNLRPSYAVGLLKALLRTGVSVDKALDIVQSRLGHTNLSDTLHYLKQIENHKSPDELAEIAIDYLLDINWDVD